MNTLVISSDNSQEDKQAFSKIQQESGGETQRVIWFSTIGKQLAQIDSSSRSNLAEIKKISSQLRFIQNNQYKMSKKLDEFEIRIKDHDARILVLEAKLRKISEGKNYLMDKEIKKGFEKVKKTASKEKKKLVKIDIDRDKECEHAEHEAKKKTKKKKN